MLNKKPFSQSLKKFISKNIIQQSHLTQYLQDSIDHNVLPNLVPPKIQPNLQHRASERMKTEFHQQDIRISSNNLRYSDRGDRSRNPEQRSSSKCQNSKYTLESGVDSIMEEIIKERQACVINQASTSKMSKLYLSKQKLRKLRITSDLKKPQKSEQTIQVEQLLGRILKMEILKQQKRSQRILRNEDGSKGKVNCRWNSKDIIKSSKQLLSYYPLCDFRHQNSDLMTSGANWQQYSKQFRNNKIEIHDIKLRRY